MKIMWSRCYAHAQLQGGISLHIIVNIIKFKRMHGLNYLSFGEQRFFFNYADIACLVSL